MKLKSTMPPPCSLAEGFHFAGRAFAERRLLPKFAIFVRAAPSLDESMQSTSSARMENWQVSDSRN